MINLLSSQNTNEKEVKEMKRNKKKGSTLIELIVVIAILGILAAVAIPRFATTLDGSKNKADIATARVLQSSAQLYQANSATNALPGAIEFKTGGAMASYLSAEDLTAAGVKAPQNSSNHFWLETATGNVKCQATAPATTGWAQLDGQSS
jgi:prepilin-type N-terminal cleavage/methylation domain-containing protein